MLIIDDKETHSNREKGSGKFRLQRGLHDIRVDYMLNGGSGDHGCVLRFKGDSRTDTTGIRWGDTGIFKQYVPQSVFFGGAYEPNFFSPSFDICGTASLECGA
eukprot:6286121-Prymnesium_polylepis.1